MCNNSNAQSVIDISVVIPIYNGEKYIPNMISNINKITEDRVQIIAIDDGSTDNSLEMLKRWECDNKHVQVIHQKNRGVSAARNTGIKNAVGKWITFVDVDDEITADFINIINCTAADGMDVVCYTRSEFAENDDETIVRIDQKKELLLWIAGCGHMDFPKDMYDAPIVYSKVYNTSFIKENNILFVEGLKKSEDMLFVLNCILKSSCIYFSKKGFYEYVHHAESVTHSRREDDLQTGLDIKKNLEAVINEHLGQSERDVLWAFNCYMIRQKFVSVHTAINEYYDEYSLKKMYRILKQFNREIGFGYIYKTAKKDTYKNLSIGELMKAITIHALPMTWCMLIKLKFLIKRN